MNEQQEVVKGLQRHVSFPDVEEVEVKFMARTGKYEAHEHVVCAKRMSFLDVENCSDTVFCMAQIFRVGGREKPEDSLCFEATFPCGERWNKIACSYFGSEEWLDDYVIKPFQKRMNFVWDNQD